MKFKEWFKTKYPKLVATGTGLVALDVVINENSKSPPKFWAGGSCGNVLTILSFLGWESYPITLLRDDEAAKKLLVDIKNWGVNTSLISQNGSGNTPIIIEKLGTSKSGIPWHRFKWTCPNCGSWLPKHKPFPTKDLEQINRKIPKAKVFYFDRVSRSSVELAKMSKSQGALIFFEPSGINDKKIFFECLKIADIVKYSHERLGHAQELMKIMSAELEIETLGSEGLRYRFGGNSKRRNQLKKMQAYPVKNLKDAAGAGDWCSAGIIHLLGSNGYKGLKSATEKDIETALSFGQALAALNCYYEGARGSMYNISRQKFKALIQNIWNDVNTLESIEEKETYQTLRVFKHICPYCVKKKSIQ